MRFLRPAAVLALFCAISAGAIIGQDKAAPAKSKGQLPLNWSKLGLSDEQKNKVFEIQAKYRDKIEDLEKQIRELKEKEQKESLEVLTPDQKTKLKEITLQKAGLGAETKK